MLIILVLTNVREKEAIFLVKVNKKDALFSSRVLKPPW